MESQIGETLRQLQLLLGAEEAQSRSRAADEGAPDETEIERLRKRLAQREEKLRLSAELGQALLAKYETLRSESETTQHQVRLSRVFIFQHQVCT
jgi:hypothetical protein